MKFAFLPMLYTTGGVLAAGVGTYAVVEREAIFGASPPAIEQQVDAAKPSEQKPEEEQVASLDQTPEEEKTPLVEAEVKPEAPSFDILRVEKDGSAVIAGKAPASSTVEILDAGKVIAKTKSASQGDFAIVLDEPLSAGTHELSIRATKEGEDPIFSEEAGIIVIPERESEQEVAVLVTKAGEASRILQTPLAKKEPVKEEAPAIVETSTASEEEAPAKPEAENAETVETKPETPEITKPAGPKPNVLIEAAEVEGAKIFIAGKGTKGSTVRIYLNNEELGDTNVTQNGAFLFEGNKLLSSGSHRVRADVIDKLSGDVLARAEVNLLHEPKVVAKVEEAPKAVEVAEAKPAAEESVAEVKEEVAAEVKEEIVVAAKEELTAAVELVAPKKDEEIKSEPAAEEIATIRTGESVIIRRGDNLWQLAVRNYGAGVRYTTIFDANQDQVRDPDLIYPGQVLKVPETAGEATNGDSG